MLNINRFIAIVLGCLLLLQANSAWSHSRDQDRSNKKAVKVIKRWVHNLGGIEWISALQNQTSTSTMQRWEPEQTLRPGDDPLHVATIHRSLTRNFNNNRTSTEMQLNSFYPTLSEFSFREVTNGGRGFIDGVDGIFSGPRAAMLSTRIGSRQKQYTLSSTLALAHHVVNHLDSIRYRGKRKISGRKHHVISINIFNQRVDLFIDAKKGRLSKLQTLEADTIYGDTKWIIVFSDWEKVSGIRLPYQVTYYLNNIKIARERRHNFEFNVSLEQDLFAIPADLQIPLDASDYRWGIQSSQFFARTLAFAIPFDLNQGRPELVDIQQVADKVFHVRGPLHNSLIIEMDDYLILVDPVLYESRSQAILSKVAQQWPNKNIEYVVASHFHADHIGGIRAYAALGAKIIVSHDTKDHYEAIFDADHTVKIDAFQAHPRNVKILEVDDDDTFSISDGHRRVQLLSIKNSHAAGLLVPYVEDVKLIFTSDLYGPGAFVSPIPPLFSHWTLDLADALEDEDLAIEYIVGAHGGVTNYQAFLDDVELLR